jgi:hypothetical protein
MLHSHINAFPRFTQSMPSNPFIFSLALLLLFSSSLALAPPTPHDPLTIHVDCSSGNDLLGDGSSSSPLASPTAARNYIRSLQPLTQDIIVAISGTCTPSNPDASLNFTLPVLQLSWVDSAPPGLSITYTVSPSAVFMGGVPLEDWQPYKGKGFAVQSSGVSNAFQRSHHAGAHSRRCRPRR